MMASSYVSKGELELRSLLYSPYARITGLCHHFQLPHFRLNPRVWCTLRQEFQQPRHISNPRMETSGFLNTGSYCFQIWRIWLHPTGATFMSSSLIALVNNSTIISRRIGQLLFFFIYYGMDRDSQTMKQIGNFLKSIVLAVLNLIV